ncbi:MAG: hypothetical protein R3F55_05710 [Alphaproteobacteria bacterium]
MTQNPTRNQGARAPGILSFPALAASIAIATQASADETHGSITATATPSVDAAFDIVEAAVVLDGHIATFRITVTGTAGATRPLAAGQLGGSAVHSYVWPTSLDPSAVGFEAGSGILSLAVTAHPDFDDTPLYDENNDGDPANDGADWHSHWVVLAPTEGCGDGALGVVDIPDGAAPPLPSTWPGLPLLIDSPGWDPVLTQDSVTVRVPFTAGTVSGHTAFDGVTAGLRVSEHVHAPLLCVTDVFDVASGDLSLPGRFAE